MTILADKVGEKIFGDNITIMDDPFYDDALVKSSFDDEGVPCKTKAVVEKGVFNGLLHSLKPAHYFHVAPTGNGFKMSTAGSISTEPTNLFIKEGCDHRNDRFYYTWNHHCDRFIQVKESSQGTAFKY